MQSSPSGILSRARSAVRGMRRAVLVRRRSLAALLVGAAVLAGLRATQPPPPPTAPVLVASEDLPGGAVLGPGDLSWVPYPPEAVPAGTVTSVGSAAGRVLAAPLRQGEPVTDVRLVAPGILGGYPGTVAVPVRVADAGAVALLAVGDRVDLIATSPEAGEARVVAARAPVVAVPAAEEHDQGPMAGGLVVVAVSAGAALALAEASVSGVLSVALDR